MTDKQRADSCIIYMINLFFLLARIEVWPSNQSFFLNFNNTQAENQYLFTGTWLGSLAGNTVTGDVLEDGTTVAVLTWKNGLPQNQLFHMDTSLPE